MRRAEIPEVRRRSIAELAEALADEVSPEGRVDPMPALEAEGVAVTYGDFGDAFDGLIEPRDRKFWVYVNLPRCGGHPDAPRARFTLGHEAGHYFLDDHRNALLAGQPPHGSITDFTSYLRVEHEADLFATHLLLPTERFVKAARRSGRGLSAVLRLRDLFGTSITSTAIRYAQCDLTPCAVVRWGPDGFAWRWVSDSLRAQGLRQTIDAAAEIPRGGATHLVRASSNAAAGADPVTTGATAAFWFRGVAHGGSRDLTLEEHAVSLGTHGALTFLTEL